MNIREGLSWRYNLYIKPRLLLHEGPLKGIIRRVNNYKFMRADSPICYIYADATNIGDKVSSLGVKLLFGEPGIELFASPAGLKTTFKTLSWLQENRPNTRIIIGGGGLLQECFVPFWENILKTSFRFALFGIGANEIEGKRNLPPTELLKEIAYRALSIHVRDSWTKGLLSFGQQVQVSVGVCPAVNYLAHNYPTKPVKTRDYLFHVQHQVDVRMVGGDPVLISDMLKSLAADLNLIYDETDHIKEDLDSLAKRYQRARIVVTSRLHGCIFSFAFKTPFVAVVTDKKASAFIETHIPDNPYIGVKELKAEMLEKIVTLNQTSICQTDTTMFDSALANNVHAMEHLKENYNVYAP